MQPATSKGIQLTTEDQPNTPRDTGAGQNHQFFFDVPAALPVKAKKIKRAKVGLTATSALIIGSLVGGGIGGAAGIAGFLVSTRPAPVVVNNQSDVSWVTAAAAASLPSVVTISINSASGAGSGSGVFLTDTGYILTNNHVITLDGVTSKTVIEVKTTDGHIYDAAVVGTDPQNDLAVIKVSAPIKFAAMKFSDSDRLNVGDSVVAIGAPLGFASSVTSGIVSALDRTIQVASSDPSKGSNSLQLWSGSGTAPVIMKVIQTDASINPGNSGGALVNQAGELVGINVAIATASATSTSSQSGSIGVGFAIPSNIAQRIGTELITYGKASHGLFGATVSNNSNAKSVVEGFSTGAKVEALTKGGAAEKSGLKVGDVINKFNGVAVSSSSELTAAVRSLKANTKVTYEVLRDGKTVRLTATLGDLANFK